MKDRQCPSCGGFCKKSGCERENVAPTDKQVKEAAALLNRNVLKMIGQIMQKHSEGVLLGCVEDRQERDRLLARIAELEAVIKSHGIHVKTYAGGEAHYCCGEKEWE